MVGCPVRTRLPYPPSLAALHPVVRTRAPAGSDRTDPVFTENSAGPRRPGDGAPIAPAAPPAASPPPPPLPHQTPPASLPPPRGARRPHRPRPPGPAALPRRQPLEPEGHQRPRGGGRL